MLVHFPFFTGALRITTECRTWKIERRNLKLSDSPTESLSHWNGEIEDLDTEQLANALCSPGFDEVREEKRGGCR